MHTAHSHVFDAKWMTILCLKVKSHGCRRGAINTGPPLTNRLHKYFTEVSCDKRRRILCRRYLSTKLKKFCDHGIHSGTCRSLLAVNACQERSNKFSICERRERRRAALVVLAVTRLCHCPVLDVEVKKMFSGSVAAAASFDKRRGSWSPCDFRRSEGPTRPSFFHIVLAADPTAKPPPTRIVLLSNNMNSSIRPRFDELAELRTALYDINVVTLVQLRPPPVCPKRRTCQACKPIREARITPRFLTESPRESHGQQPSPESTEARLLV